MFLVRLMDGMKANLIKHTETASPFYQDYSKTFCNSQPPANVSCLNRDRLVIKTSNQFLSS